VGGSDREKFRFLGQKDKEEHTEKSNGKKNRKDVKGTNRE